MDISGLALAVMFYYVPTAAPVIYQVMMNQVVCVMIC